MRLPICTVVLLCTVGYAFSSVGCWAAEDECIDLQGSWRIALDPDDQGITEAWYSRVLTDAVRLPGSLQEQGYGDDPRADSPWIGMIREEEWAKPKYAPYRQADRFKMPFWLQPKKVYVGPAWYQRDVTIPSAWDGKRIVLHLERCHWFTQVWLDNQLVGRGESLSVPHQFDLTGKAAPGRHRLTIRVDNRVLIGVGVNAHSVSDHTQTAWNGIIGRIELRATPRVFIRDVQVYPDVSGRQARVAVTVGRVGEGSAESNASPARLSLRARCGQHEVSQSKDVSISQSENAVELLLPMGPQVRLWDEFSPNLYQLQVTLISDAGTDRRDLVFGMRHVSVKDKRFMINGRPLMFRGTLECCIFPLTGYPPTDLDSWKRVIRICKEHGLNHIRFHSHCPPEAAFTAADELGFYYQVECASWANQGSALGLGRPIDRWIYDEADRIRREYGNHPSFVLMAYGNEPAGPDRGAKFLSPWVVHQKKMDPRRLYTSAAGWPLIAESDYHCTPQPRIQAWGAGLSSRINARPPETTTDYRDFVDRQDVPVISHEIGQWCVYPNFEEISKYTGVLQAKNFEIFRDFLEARHMGDQARDFLMASGKLQTLCYKEEIESALRTPSFGGFQLLDLHDFPGQGTALVGVLDPFWDSKPYVAPAEYRRFCNATVPLVRMPKRVWTSGETFRAAIEVTHYGPEPLPETRATWTVAIGDSPVASGTLAARTIPLGSAVPLGQISCSLSDIPCPTRVKLTVTLEGTDVSNDWDLWVYPEKRVCEVPAHVLVVGEMSDDAVRHLEEGGSVFLLADPRSVKQGPQIGFSPIFWNTAWTGGQAPHTLGILCDPNHPALTDFPTDFHTNWQWWDLVHRSNAMVMDNLPPALRPIVQVVPDWFEPQRLGLVFEARLGSGKLLVCSIDLENELEDRPVARQLRFSLLRYMASSAFQPQHSVTADQVRSLFRELPVVQKLGATIQADSAQAGYGAVRAIDGRTETMWHTAWQPRVAPAPHWLILDLKRSLPIAGLTYTPRMDQPNGRIGDYEIYVSSEADRWNNEPVAKGTWNNDERSKVVRFNQPVVGRYIKLVALREVRGGPWTSAAEVDVILSNAP